MLTRCSPTVVEAARAARESMALECARAYMFGHKGHGVGLHTRRARCVLAPAVAAMPRICV